MKLFLKYNTDESSISHTDYLTSLKEVVVDGSEFVLNYVDFHDCEMYLKNVEK